MARHTFDFIARHDWIRSGLMCEPRGHEMMFGAMLVPSTRSDCDTGVLYLETSGVLPMCGHATIGVVTFGIERGLDAVIPSVEGVAYITGLSTHSIDDAEPFARGFLA